jgi:NAD(P)-dependent dehydrogenase (short-subunit alcohol dehydrogenase family)
MTRALVTGGAIRIGRAIALQLAKSGFDVAVHYGTSEDQANEVVDEIRAMGRQAVALRADLTKEDEVQALVPAAKEALSGPILCLVNNASLFEYDRLDTATRAGWDRHMECNLRAPFVLTQAVAADLPEPARDHRGEPVAQGLILNLLDQRVHKLTPEFMTYTLSKMGLWALTQTAAQGLAPKARVNAIGPGPTLQGGRQSLDHFQRQRAATVLQRGSNPEDVTAAVRFFLESPGVTGQMIATDGGQHLAWETPDVLGVE